MAITRFLGTAVTVQQVATQQITAYDVATTYTLTINSVSISTIAAGTAIATAAALVVLAEASTHPYFTSIDWSDGGTDTVTGTSAANGIPFTFLITVSGGTGTVGAYAVATVGQGPNHWDTVTNWSTGSLPVNGDEVYIQDTSVNIFWGLDQSAVTLDILNVDKTYTGLIGLNRQKYASSGSPENVDASATEYRDIYLQIGSTLVSIGTQEGVGNPTGSRRILLDLGSDQSTIDINGTANTSSEIGKPSVRLKMNNASNILFVNLAPGGVGIAVDAPDETSTVSLVSISDTSTTSKVSLSKGVTVTTWSQNGGANVLDAAGTITLVTCKGGTLTIVGDYGITTLTIEAGTVTDKHIASGAAIATLNIDGGIYDAQQTTEPKTITQVNLGNGAQFKADKSVLTITDLQEPTSRYTLITQ